MFDPCSVIEVAGEEHVRRDLRFFSGAISCQDRGVRRDCSHFPNARFPNCFCKVFFMQKPFLYRQPVHQDVHDILIGILQHFENFSYFFQDAAKLRWSIGEHHAPS